MTSPNRTASQSGAKHATKQGKRAKGLKSGKKLEAQKPLKVDAYLQIPGTSGEGGG